MSFTQNKVIYFLRKLQFISMSLEILNWHLLPKP